MPIISPVGIVPVAYVVTATRLKPRGGSRDMALDRYAIGDTPTFEVDVWAADGVTPVTPVGPVTVTVTNLRTKGTIGGSPVTGIAGNKVTVTLPAAATLGQFRAAAQVTVDGTPTIRTATYDYEVVATSEAS